MLDVKGVSEVKAVLDAVTAVLLISVEEVLETREKFNLQAKAITPLGALNDVEPTNIDVLEVEALGALVTFWLEARLAENAFSTGDTAAMGGKSSANSRGDGTLTVEVVVVVVVVSDWVEPVALSDLAVAKTAKAKRESGFITKVNNSKQA